ncbi:choice-of-anchor Q domain-containing protein [Gimesia fumaroli]|uniref:Probable pectate lyase C n=1 Tax=Gimesia fumaroli TaxID=2527976 RepID=A0A518IKJ4_9PLAN|nr:choice-of-anchor Q domain-containing protein [Gimesia fumaroli]QDV53622.1 putative outer membrane protein pmp6 precursor [Gimesia fumaroli]
MFPSLWLSSLKRQLYSRFSRSAHARRNRQQRHQLPSARALISHNAVERLEDRTLLTAFTVVNTNDSGAGSLRDAIEQANANAGADTISFDAALAAQTIVVSTEMQITDDLMLTGLGADLLTLDGNGDSRIFNIDDGSFETMLTVSLSGMTLTNAFNSIGGAVFSHEDLTLENCTISGNQSGWRGAGVYSEQGRLFITGSTFAENQTLYSSSSGAGIYSVDSTLTVRDSTFHKNETFTSGGGIFYTYETGTTSLEVSNCTFTENIGGGGGGISVFRGSVIVSDSTFYQNQAMTEDAPASGGGGISVRYGAISVTNSRFEQNTAVENGGAIYHDSSGTLVVSESTFLQNSAQSGGGIYNLSSLLSVIDSEFTENEASGDSESTGGGIYAMSGEIIVQGSDFSDNSAQSYGGGVGIYRTKITVERSTFSQNSAGLSGGGLSIRGDSNNYARVTIAESTFVENSSGVAGGAVYSTTAGSAKIYNTTISQNQTATYGGGLYSIHASSLSVVNNTIVLNEATGSDSQSGDGGGIYIVTSGATVINNIIAGNLADNNSQIKGVIGNVPNLITETIDGLIDPELKNNRGGKTKTHFLLDGSAAINAGNNQAVAAAGLLYDQRGTGYARIYDGIVDFGAYEFNDHLLVVNTVADEVDGDYSYGNLSLREAIQLTNESPFHERIEFDASLLSGQTIVLTDEILISDNLTIVGLGADQLTLDGNGDSRIFRINYGSLSTKISVDISGLTFTNGTAATGGAIYSRETLSISDSVFSGNSATQAGGGIFNFSGDLSVVNSKLIGNTTGTSEDDGSGGAISHSSGMLTVDASEFTDNEAIGAGGAIYISSSVEARISHSTFSTNVANTGGAISKGNGLLIVEDCDFTENQAIAGTGGAFYVTGGTTQINASEFTENVSQTSGGAIHSLDGTLAVSTTTFLENRASGLGGAVHIGLADVTIQESTFTGNQGNSGGAIGMQGYGSSLVLVSSTLNQNVATISGGALFNNGAISVTVLNSTFSDNRAGFHGGAIYEFVNTVVSVINSTIINNEATTFTGGGIFRQQGGTGTFELRNSIVSGNRGGQFAGSYSGSNNIMQSSLVGLIDPVLRDNGGPTLTHALVTGSAAIDAGSNSVAQSAGLTKDQRGGIHHRILNGTVDIGAYESYSGVLQVDSFSDVVDGNYAAGQLTLREAIEIANSTPEDDQIVFSSSLANQTIVLSSEILISSSMTITGLGAELLTISGNNSTRIFRIDDSNAETDLIVGLSGLSLINGFSNNGGAILNFENLTVSDSVLSGNDVRVVQFVSETLNNGGAISNNDGTLTVLNSTFTDNFAFSGGGIYSSGGSLTVTGSEFNHNSATSRSGGGLFQSDGNLTVHQSQFLENSGKNGAGIAFEVNATQNEPQPVWTMNVTNSTFIGNTGGTGGGIHFDSPSKTLDQLAFVTDCTFTQNVTVYDGAGIFFNSGQAVIERCDFTENISDRTGGGIGNEWATLMVKESSFTGNSARLYGGGIANGGFFEQEGGGDVTIINCTIAENVCASAGGGFFTYSGTVNIINSTLSGNYATQTGGAIYTRWERPSVVNIYNSTLTGNSAKYGGGISSHSNPFTITNSIVAGNSSHQSPDQNNGWMTFQNSIVQDEIDGLLDPVLRDNGGHTKTHALLLGSAAIDAGDNEAVASAEIEFDQRGIGYDRIVGGAVDIGAYEVQVLSTQIDLRIVDTKSTTSENGESTSLPSNLGWLDEWSGYWLEIWISTPSTSELGILSAALDLTYNTAITSATDIEYGAAFTINQTGIINDQTGTIENLSAETSLTDVGGDQHVLFARIKFESTVEDGVDLDLEGQSLNPQSPGFVVNHPDILFIDDLASEELHGPAPATQVWANPFDLDDNDAINIRDLILFINQYSIIPSESNSTYAWFADYNQDDRVNFRDLISLIHNYGKRKSNQTPISYPQNYPEAWSQLLNVDSQSEVQTNAQPVTQSAAEAVLGSVVEQFSPKLTPSQTETLAQVDIEVVDLAGETLGRAVPGTIYIDINAAGRGWFVDATPADHSEFAYASELTLIALPDSEAADGVDLWTVILHELGHLLGYEHEAEGVMQETLVPGVRKLSDWADDETDSFFTDLTEDTSLFAF